MHSKQRQIIDSHAFKHTFIQGQIIKWILKKSGSWSSDTRSSENLSPDSKFWYVDPLQKQGHISFCHLIPCRSKVLVILYFSTPYRSKVTTIIYFSIPCRSKVTTLLWYVDPLQKQGHIWFWHLIPCRSKVLAILYFSTPCRSKVTTIIYFSTPCRSKVTTHGDPLQKQGHIWFLYLIPCRSKVLAIIGLPAKAKSQLFLEMLILCRSKISVFLFSTWRYPNKISVSIFTWVFTLIKWIFLKFSYYHVKLK